jgi:hypothetical protein
MFNMLQLLNNNIAFATAVLSGLFVPCSRRQWPVFEANSGQILAGEGAIMTPRRGEVSHAWDHLNKHDHHWVTAAKSRTAGSSGDTSVCPPPCPRIPQAVLKTDSAAQVRACLWRVSGRKDVTECKET